MAKVKRRFNDPVESYGYIDYAKLAKKLSRLRLIDFDADVGVYSEGSIVKLADEGISVPPAYDGPLAANGSYSGKALKVTVPAGGSKTVWVGVSPAFKPQSLFYLESSFYLQSGLNAVVNWGIGSELNRAEESSAFRVTFEGKDDWNLYARSLPQEFFQTHNWVVFNLTNTSNMAKSLYVARVMFAEYPEQFGYTEDIMAGYIPVTETLYTGKVYLLGDYPFWMGAKSRCYGCLISLITQSDGVNTLDARVFYGGRAVLTYSYSGSAVSPTQFKSFMVDHRRYRGARPYLDARISGGKGYIRQIRIQHFLNQGEPPQYTLYTSGSVTTNNDGVADTFTILDYTTTPLPCRYAVIERVELSVSGTSAPVAHINMDGNQACEDVPVGSSIVLEDLGECEKLDIVANDSATGATTVSYKIYYKRRDALLLR